MFGKNHICNLFSIRFPIIQAGMVWCSGWKLACAVSNAGGLGLIGAGSMEPDLLEEHVKKARTHTVFPFGVNIPLIGRHIPEKIEVILRQQIKIVFTSAGNPQVWTPELKKNGCRVVHVISSSRFALKAMEAGVDAIVAEGFEAGGHNGKEETTSFVLIPAVREVTELPLIAAGGMYSGRSLLAAFSLGADAIQVGSRFAIANESSAHDRFKNKVIEINEGDTRLVFKKLTPVRMICNKLYERIAAAEDAGASQKVLRDLLSDAKSRHGIFEGDTDEGELEIGQVSALLTKQQPAGEIVHEILVEFIAMKNKITEL
jgi:enoyl-[acyl-carrier protein] reductase II